MNFKKKDIYSDLNTPSFSKVHRNIFWLGLHSLWSLDDNTLVIFFLSFSFFCERNSRKIPSMGVNVDELTYFYRVLSKWWL